MSENQTKKTEQTKERFSVSDLLPVLKRFADGYAPAKHEKRVEKLSGEARDVLKAKRAWAETCLRQKRYLVGKTAEPEANSVDRTFRRERRVAADGDPWENVLKAKNVDLWEMLKAIKSKLQAIETVVRSPEPAECFEPYVPLYERRFESLGVELVRLLGEVYSGSCWKSFRKGVQKRANETYNDIVAIMETEGVQVPDDVVVWARKQQEQAAKANAEPVAQAA